MTIKRVFAVVAVRDLRAAEAWYAELFGAGPDARPMDGLLEWHFGAAGDLQLVQDAERAGGSLLTLQADDVGSVEDQTSAGEGFRTVQDPDGNAITLVGV